MSKGSDAVKRWRKRHPDKARDAMARENAKRGGYVRPSTPEADHPRPVDGRCDLCKKVKTLHRDHCHLTGQHRGWLCVSCNVTLGKVETISLDALRAYLEPWY